MNKRLTVMVTGVGGGGHGRQIIKALRLSSLKYEIVGGDMDRVSEGLAVADIPYLLPPANHREYIPCVISVCKKHNVKALFHGSEAELKVMSNERQKIEGQGIFLPVNPKPVIDLCMDKAKTMAFLERHGFTIPRTRAVSSIDQLSGIDFLPVVLKPSVGGGGSANVMIAQSADELFTLGKYMLGIYPEFMIQEYVGTVDSEYTVGVLISFDGELLNSIAVKRMILPALSNRIKVDNRTGRDDLGALLAVSNGISQGEIGAFKDVTGPCEKIALAIGARGAVNIQCRLVNGKVCVFEINPRFSGTTSLRAMVGYNEPDILIRRHVLHEKIAPRFPYKCGLILRELEERLIGKGDILDAMALLRASEDREICNP